MRPKPAHVGAKLCSSRVIAETSQVKAQHDIDKEEDDVKAVVRFPFTACMLLTNLMQMKTSMSMKFNGSESEEDSKPKANRAARGRTETARRQH